jgi:acetyl esterase/lipase
MTSTTDRCAARPAASDACDGRPRGPGGRAIRAVIAGLLLSAGCGGSAAPVEVDPPAAGAPLTQREWRDLAYAQTSGAQRLDLYLPPTGEGPFPVVVWVHGGGWQGGDKRLGPSSPALALRARGFAVASVNYRLSGEATFPAQIHDVKAAVRWLRANAARHRLDGARMGAWGVSAGGHLAALLGTSGGVAELEGSALGNATHSSRVAAVVDWYGPADFPNFAAHGLAAGCGAVRSLAELGALLGGPPSQWPEAARLASPVTWVSADDPPFLIQHGTEDCTVPWPQSKALHDALAAAIGPTRVSLKLLRAGHGGPPFQADSTLAPITAFLEAHLR